VAELQLQAELSADVVLLIQTQGNRFALKLQLKCYRN